jgi:hypothetical protein
MSMAWVAADGRSSATEAMSAACGLLNEKDDP